MPYPYTKPPTYTHTLIDDVKTHNTTSHSLGKAYLFVVVVIFLRDLDEIILSAGVNRLILLLLFRCSASMCEIESESHYYDVKIILCRHFFSAI